MNDLYELVREIAEQALVGTNKEFDENIIGMITDETIDRLMENELSNLVAKVAEEYLG